MIQQLFPGIYPKAMKSLLAKRYFALVCSLQHYSQQPIHGSNLSVHEWMNGKRKCDVDLYTCTYTQRSIIHPQKGNPGIWNNMHGPYRTSH